MYESIKRLYLSGRLSKAGVQAAAKKGWITGEQVQEICGEG